MPSPKTVPARDYPLLLGGQFLGAFGDQAILALLLGPLLFRREANLISEEAMRNWNTLLTALLFAPCVLLAPLAGFCNDRFPKSACLVAGNAIKLAGALLCAAGLACADGGDARAVLQAAGYLVVGAGTCLYGPAKYGILPEILPAEKLVRANGHVEVLTLLAILGGFTTGSVLADVFRASPALPHAIILALYAAALAANAAMARTPGNPAVRLGHGAGEFFQRLRDLLAAPRTRLILAGTALFWIVGAAMKSHFQPWGQGVLGLRSNTEISLLAVVLSIGVMAGSLLAGRLRKVGDLRGVPRAGIALAAVLLLAWMIGASTAEPAWLRELPDGIADTLRAAGLTGRGLGLSPRAVLMGLELVLPACALLVASGFFAGLFLIPLNAALQHESEPGKLGKTIAIQNLFDYLGMCGSGLYLFAANTAGAGLRTVFLGLALLTLAASLWMQTRPALRSR
ncbi:MAG: MFS transporter [Puniceicoccales bacterium]|jgi:LPLT family lysophospholipid transporter-like MFS transporter|nr:MFS transporter [Puniceicoccales bacterium]